MNLVFSLSLVMNTVYNKYTLSKCWLRQSEKFGLFYVRIVFLVDCPLSDHRYIV